MGNPLGRTVAAIAVASVLFTAGAGAQEVKHYRFAYDQPRTTGYGILGDIFSDKLKELSKGTMLIEQYPGAQLGQEPQVLQLVKSGDVEFCISSSAKYNSSNSFSPERNPVYTIGISVPGFLPARRIICSARSRLTWKSSRRRQARRQLSSRCRST